MSVIDWQNAQDLKRDLIAGGWFTPDTYGKEYCPPENAPAVYLFLLHGWVPGDDVNDFGKAIVAYVGMSRWLKRRWEKHSILSELERSGRYIQRWFCPTPKPILRDQEAVFIQKFDPPWNIQGRRRGVTL